MVDRRRFSVVDQMRMRTTAGFAFYWLLPDWFVSHQIFPVISFVVSKNLEKADSFVRWRCILDRIHQPKEDLSVFWEENTQTHLFSLQRFNQVSLNCNRTKVYPEKPTSIGICHQSWSWTRKSLDRSSSPWYPSMASKVRSPFNSPVWSWNHPNCLLLKILLGNSTLI